jgi:hypothetical protein
MDFDSTVTIWGIICTFIVMFIGMFWMITLSNASYTIQMDDDMRIAIESLNRTMPYIIVNQYNYDNKTTQEYHNQIINLTTQLVGCGCYNDILEGKISDLQEQLKGD